VSRELRELIFRIVAENRTWGAPRIHGELKMLDFDISERMVLRWMRKAPRVPEPAKRWTAFLKSAEAPCTSSNGSPPLNCCRVLHLSPVYVPHETATSTSISPRA
jgi:hypothetical protein